MFDEVLETIENDDIRDFAKKCIEKIDPWFYIAPAASSGRHHPQTSLGEGGLMRHTLSVVRFLNYLLEIESIQNQFTSRERDIMRVAALMHDSKKSGNQEDYEVNKQTKFEHPLLAAEFVKSIGLGILPEHELNLCADIIATHMGQFNTSKKSDVVLPKPENKYQILVHTCDYLASRKDIEVRTDKVPEYKNIDKDTIETYRFNFGKHSGETIPEVYAKDPGYIRWVRENIQREPIQSLLKEFKAETY